MHRNALGSLDRLRLKPPISHAAALLGQYASQTDFRNASEKLLQFEDPSPFECTAEEDGERREVSPRLLQKRAEVQ